MAVGDRPRCPLGGRFRQRPRRLAGGASEGYARRATRAGVLHISKQAARVLAIDEANLPDPHRTLNEVGFDSLTGVEFVNRVGRSVGQQFNPAMLFDYPTLEALAGYVVRDVLQMETAAEATAAEPEDAAAEERGRRPPPCKRCRKRAWMRWCRSSSKSSRPGRARCRKSNPAQSLEWLRRLSHPLVDREI